MIFDILTFQLSQPFLEHSPILFYFILIYQKNSNTCSIYIYVKIVQLFFRPKFSVIHQEKQQQSLLDIIAISSSI
jgi:hypothetical protein